ncbi:MAG: hypothetical protein WD070_03020, partial [Pirellulaceae bacterium]
KRGTENRELPQRHVRNVSYNANVTVVSRLILGVNVQLACQFCHREWRGAGGQVSSREFCNYRDKLTGCRQIVR